jgi:hypothetical protein
VSEGKKRSKRTPQEKKRLELERDTIDGVAEPKLFRKAWPKKKARVERAHRRATKQAVQRVEPAASGAAESIPRERVKKWKGTAVPLAKMIELNASRRRARHGRKKKLRTLFAEARAAGATSIMWVMRGDEVEDCVYDATGATPLPAPPTKPVKPQRKPRRDRLPKPD